MIPPETIGLETKEQHYAHVLTVLHWELTEKFTSDILAYLWKPVALLPKTLMNPPH